MKRKIKKEVIQDKPAQAENEGTPNVSAVNYSSSRPLLKKDVDVQDEDFEFNDVIGIVK